MMLRPARFRRGAALTSAAVALALTLTACGEAKSSSSSAGGGNNAMSLLSEWTDGGSKTSIDATIQAWNSANSNAKVSQRSIGNEDFTTASRTAMSGTTPPDILQFEGFSDTVDYAKAGKLTDLTSWWNAHKSQFVLADSPGFKRACEYQGKVYCIPNSANAQSVLFYNKDLLEKNGIAAPKTYDDFLAASATLKGKGITPLALGDKDGWPGAQLWMSFVVQLCGTTVADSAVDRTGAKWTDPCFTKAAQMVDDLRSQGYLPKGVVSDDYNAMTSQFLAGKAAFISTGSWFIGSWQTSPPPFSVGAEYLPAISGAQFSDDKVAYGGDVIGIPSAGKNQAKAQDFLSFLFSQDQANQWAKNYYFSSVKGSVSSSGPAEVKDLYAATESATDTLASLDLQLPPAVGEKTLYDAGQALLGGKLTAAQFTAQLEESAAKEQGPSVKK